MEMVIVIVVMFGLGVFLLGCAAGLGFILWAIYDDFIRKR